MSPPRAISAARAAAAAALPVLAGLTVLLLLLGQAALAALPPGAQRAREIAAVAEAAAAALEAPVESVRLIENGRFEVRAGACRLEVRIIFLPPKLDRPPMPGPLPFRAVPGQAACER